MSLWQNVRAYPAYEKPSFWSGGKLTEARPLDQHVEQIIVENVKPGEAIEVQAVPDADRFQALVLIGTPWMGGDK